MSSAGEIFDLIRSPSCEGVWLSVSEVARLKGVEKSTISRRVKRLIESGQLETKAGPGGQKLIKLAAYDRATGENDVGGLGGEGSPARNKGGGLAREQARRVAYQADMAELDLAERRSAVLSTEGVRAAAAEAAEKIVAHLRSIPAVAETVAAAVARGGEKAARATLKDFVYELQCAIAEDFKPNDDGEIVDEPWPLAPDALAEIEATTAERWRQLRGAA